jgi:hypothetical protein
MKVLTLNFVIANFSWSQKNDNNELQCHKHRGIGARKERCHLSHKAGCLF